MGSMGREAIKVMGDERIQTILEDWANKWGTDCMPRFSVWGSETYEMYKERLIQEYNKRIKDN